MNPAIKRYLDEHGATYTPEALRKGLLDAGYDPAEVDAALSGWNPSQSPGPEAQARRTFRQAALWLHVGALLAVFVLLVTLKGTTAIGTALLGCAVLGVALVIGWAISSLIGRALLPATGAVVALIVPAISALLLGGSCFALLSSAIGTPPRDGTVHLEITEGLTFDGSGSALCYVGNDGVQINTQDLGAIEGRNIVAFINWYPASDPATPAPVGGTQISIGLEQTSETQALRSWSMSPDTQVVVDASPDGLVGTAEFQDLAPEVENPTDQVPEPISGTVSWDCE